VITRVASVHGLPKSSGPQLSRGRGFCLKHGIRHETVTPRQLGETASQWVLRFLKAPEHAGRRGVRFRYQPGDPPEEQCEMEVTFTKVVMCLLAVGHRWSACEIPVIEFVVARKPLATILYRYREENGEIRVRAVVPE